MNEKHTDNLNFSIKGGRLLRFSFNLSLAFFHVLNSPTHLTWSGHFSFLLQFDNRLLVQQKRGSDSTVLIANQGKLEETISGIEVKQMQLLGAGLTIDKSDFIFGVLMAG